MNPLCFRVCIHMHHAWSEILKVKNEVILCILLVNITIKIIDIERLALSGEEKNTPRRTICNVSTIETSKC